MKKQALLLSIVGIAGAGLVTVGATQVSAHGFGSGNTTMIATMAQKLGVSEDKVKSVFTELHAERQQEMQAKMEERLAAAVKEGKITEAQKTLILAKHKEMQAKMESTQAAMATMTPEARRAEMEKKRAEMQTWATQNGIDITYLGGFGRGVRGHGMGR